ncbi:hypothetical protein DMC30DRAFT_207 [Rhodotorula diobovata]|uniref:Uncharacterized protein n=1 Tax=Rhodotorula diobovata TaxID=5288 RepID=A0A5C5G693_9BASI|nr:hypothetical protein DMC30DRAFT_207 [Rhodotorula diobovata]
MTPPRYLMSCHAVDVGEAGAHYAQLLTDYNQKALQDHDLAPNYPELRYGPISLAAAALWIHELGDQGRALALARELVIPTNFVKVRVGVIVPEENWRDSYDDVQGVHDEDRLTAADEKSYVTNNGWLAFARSQPLGNVPGLKAFSIKVNTAAVFRCQLPPDPRSAFLACTREPHEGLFIQKVPSALISIILNVHGAHQKQRKRNEMPTSKLDKYDHLIACEVLALVLLYHLCKDHARTPDGVEVEGSPQHFRPEHFHAVLNRMPAQDSAACRAFVTTSLRPRGQIAELAYDVFFASTPSPPLDVDENAGLVRNFRDALAWLHGLFPAETPHAGHGHHHGPQHTGVNSLGAAHSRFFPQGRRLGW